MTDTIIAIDYDKYKIYVSAHNGKDFFTGKYENSKDGIRKMFKDVEEWELERINK